MGREEGRIGFGEDAVEREDRGGLEEMGHFGVGDIAGKRDEEAKVEAALGVGERAGETMEDAAEIGGAPVFFVEDAEAIGPGIAAMDDDGEMGLAGEAELAAKDGLLNVARRVVIEIIEADFAPGEDAGVLGEAGEFGEPFFGGEFGFVRMDADGGVDPVVFFGERNGDVEAIGGGAAADGEDILDAGVAGASEHGVAVGVELGKFEMGVRIDDVQGKVPGECVRLQIVRQAVAFEKR